MPISNYTLLTANTTKGEYIFSHTGRHLSLSPYTTHMDRGFLSHACMLSTLLLAVTPEELLGLRYMWWSNSLLRSVRPGAEYKPWRLIITVVGRWAGDSLTFLPGSAIPPHSQQHLSEDLIRNMTDITQAVAWACTKWHRDTEAAIRSTYPSLPIKCPEAIATPTRTPDTFESLGMRAVLPLSAQTTPLKDQK